MNTALADGLGDAAAAVAGAVLAVGDAAALVADDGAVAIAALGAVLALLDAAASVTADCVGCCVVAVGAAHAATSAMATAEVKTRTRL